MKNILVTGAGKGIGFQCVKSLSFSNNKIFALIRSRKDLKGQLSYSLSNYFFNIY